ncbi:DUF6790 family protein [Nocardia transvalensis]|uniref:DUF6790 family protein n=1 Tax=Nocardia transvalensis TaxID=37333 RepID=UPI002B4B14D5|nr:DUF6790 family protein [Nocardia transvalensis]
MNEMTYLAQSAFPLIWILIAVVGALVRTRHSPSWLAALETWQRWWAVAALGFGSLWMTISFLTVPEVMATAIGFNRTPFQFEIAFANLGLAVLGFRAASATARERITIGLGAGMFLWGAAIGHVYQWFAHGDHAPGNTGGVLVYDLLLPAVMIILARCSQRPIPASFTFDRELATEPNDLGRYFIERVNAGDVDGLVALYEADAVLAFPPGNLATGHAEIRKVYEQFVATAPVLSPGKQHPALVSGDLALTATTLTTGEVTAEVARRQPDGSWLLVVDQPVLVP